MKKLDSLFVCVATVLAVAGCARQNAGAPVKAAGAQQGGSGEPSRFQVPTSQLASINDETGATVANLGFYYLQQAYGNSTALYADGGCTMSYDVVDALSGDDFAQSARSYCANLQKRGFTSNCAGIDGLAQQITQLDYTLLGMCSGDNDVSQMSGTAQQLVTALQKYRTALGLTNQMF